ncbi:MAG: diguanylate cyclase [Candidatus Aureabacteria bacterium]|nr:diguanylate cyclase [Candidatus Auribacterota bacterium]
MLENSKKDTGPADTQKIDVSSNGKKGPGENGEFGGNAFEALPYPFYIIDPKSGYIITANSASGFEPGDKSSLAAHYSDNPAIEESLTWILEEVKKTKKNTNIEKTYPDNNGNQKEVEIHCHPIFNENNIVVQLAVYVQDVTKRKKAEEEFLQEKEELTNITRIDHLTGLYNYRYLTERLSAELSRAQRSILPMALVTFDIDNFASINDTEDRSFGDFVLKEVGSLIKKEGRQEDVIFRVKDNRFAVLLIESGYAGAKRFSEQIINKINLHDFKLNGQSADITVNVGAACFPDKSIKTCEDLLKVTDAALIEAKDFGKGRAVFYKNKGTPLAEGSGKTANIETLKKTILDFGDKAKKSIVNSIHTFTDSLEQSEHLNKGSTQQIFNIAKKVSGLEEIYSVAKNLDIRKPFIGEHFEWMISIIEKVSSILKIKEEEVQTIKQAAALYDIGKIYISDTILQKTAPLTVEECQIIKEHPRMAFEILETTASLNGTLQMILHHHEKYDGSGYPQGLQSQNIPIGARILAVADTYQAMISERPYRKALSEADALKMIEKGSGTHFDPGVVKAFISNIC